MNNLYFYAYYLFIRFAKKLNPKDLDVAFTGVAALSIPIAFNIFSFFLWFEKSLLTKKNTFFISLIIGLPVLIFNYFVLYRKSKNIVDYYDNNYQSRLKKNFVVLGIVIYLITSFIVFGYFAYLKRKDMA